MKLSDQQLEVLKDDTRFKVICSGRRWGKSTLAMKDIAKACVQPNQKVYAVYPTYKMAKTILWPDLKERLAKLRWVEKINEVDMTITLVNGSTISLRGGDDPAKIRGITASHCVIDEAAFCKPELWEMILRPTLSTTEGTATLLSTPVGKDNYFYDLYEKGQQEDETEWKSWQFTTIEGGLVSEKEIEQARKDLTESIFRQEYEASFEVVSERIFYAFDTKTHVKPYNGDLDKHKEVYIGCDFNVSPITASIAVLTDQGLHFIDEIMMYGSNTDELVEEIKNRYPTKKVLIYPDPSGAQRKTSAGGRTDITILQNAGFTVIAPRKHDAVRDGINAVNSALMSSTGVVKLQFDPKCKNLIQSLQKHMYKPGTRIPMKNEGKVDYSHFSDGLRYLVGNVFKIRRDIPTLKPNELRWNVQTY